MTGVAHVEPGGQGVEIGVQCGGPLGVGLLLVRRDGRPVVGLEVLAEVGRLGEVRDAHRASLALHVGDAVTEQRADVVLVAPQRRGRDAGRRGCDVRLHGREHLADEPGRRPADDADPAPGGDDADELVGGGLVVRGEHDADRRHGDVELAVVVGQVLGVGDLPLQHGTRGGGLPSALLEQLGRQVAGDHAGAGKGGGDGHVAGAGGDVQHQVALTDPRGVHEHGPELRDQVGGDGLVVAGRPHGGVLLLQRGVSGGVANGLSGLGHGVLPRAWPGPSGHVRTLGAHACLADPRRRATSRRVRRVATTREYARAAAPPRRCGRCGRSGRAWRRRSGGAARRCGR